MEAEVKSSVPGVLKGLTRVAQMRSAMPMASFWASSRFSHKMTNSSPPRRATVSPGRSISRRRLATPIDQLVARRMARPCR